MPTPRRVRRQAVYLEALQTLPNLRVLFGHYLENQIECRRCGSTWLSHDEKMTDVNIATELLTDAFDDRFDTVLLVTADSDLIRPIEVVRARFPEQRAWCWLFRPTDPPNVSNRLARPTLPSAATHWPQASCQNASPSRTGTFSNGPRSGDEYAFLPRNALTI